MVYRLNDRLDHVGKRHGEINGEAALYSDSFANPTFTLKLTRVSIGRTEAEELQSSGPIMQVRLVDMFIDTDQLTLDGASFLVPRNGHQIKTEDGTIYKVVSGPSDSPPWCYTTPSKKRVRVHTVEYQTS